ncbi:glycosyl transferase family 28 [Arthrobacter sp. MYb211]|uniref:glycosyltransferase n=1 Tax=unclassified Arthrobacter TaxID=235627 RepID=UPI000CFC0D6B|nr:MULTISPECIES: glycosyltransferase [unclassified Arthrobacter]PRA10544.1 glycosyl transferase family 28 [Arthrobacter sp. MYb221]PRC06115.1 glycosyl transferase family 28 [Arthrobacter sp. MYb211]
MKSAKPDVTVLALVGTDHHPFDRMVNLVDELLAGHDPSDGALSCLIQFGTAQAPSSAQGRDFLAKDEVKEHIDRADLVLCHGGPSTIVEILRSGKMPLVMPRDPERGEHVDGHQQRFARHMAGLGLVQLVDSVQQVRAEVEQFTAGADERLKPGIELPSPDESALRLGLIVDRLIAAAPAQRWWRRGGRRR